MLCSARFQKCSRSSQEGQLSFGDLDAAIQALEVLVRQGSSFPVEKLYSVVQGCVAKGNLRLGRRVHDLVANSGHDSDAVLANHIIHMYTCHGKLEEAAQVLLDLSAPDTFVWASLLSAYVKHGQPKRAIQLYREMRQPVEKLDNYVFVAVLKACTATKNPTVGKEIHADVVQRGFEANVFVANTLVDMYTKCGSLLDARAVFDRMPTKTVVTWTAMIGGYARQGLVQEAFSLYSLMEHKGASLGNAATFVCLLKACATSRALHEGECLHNQIRERGLEGNLIVGSSLVDMYAKCGDLKAARTVFDNLSKKNLVTWGAMIWGYANGGLGEEALDLFETMQEEGLAPDRVLFLCGLKACAAIGAVQKGRQLHSQIRDSGLESDTTVGSSLLDMYAKCGNLEDAQRVFDRLPNKDLVTWSAMIGGYVRHGPSQKALELFESMQQDGLRPDTDLLVCALKACAGLGAMQQGRKLHLLIQERGLDADVNISNALLDMYMKCGSLEDAASLFDKMAAKNVVTWTAMILGCAQQGLGQEVLSLLERMQQDGLIPDRVSLICSIKACGIVGALQVGKRLHRQILERDSMGRDVGIASSLVDMYVKCGSLEDAEMVFQNVPSRDVETWNAMLAGYAKCGLSEKVLNLFEDMCEEAVPPDRISYTIVIGACGTTGAIQKGKELHSQVQQCGLITDLVVANTVMDMYARCGQVEDAQSLFSVLPVKDVVAWTALINSFSHSNDSRRAIQCFEQMLQHAVQPDGAAFLCLLVACSHVGFKREGQMYFRMMVEQYGIAPTADHYSCMVDILGRSGHLEEAEHMLYTMPFVNDTVGWTALLSACRTYGDVECGKRCFDRLAMLQPQQASAYVLMSRIYADVGRWVDVAEMENLRMSAGAWKKVAKTWIETNNKLHEFTVRESRNDISSKLRSMNLRIKEAGHVPHTELVLKPLSEQAKEDSLCGHAEKLALAYGLLTTPDRATLLITKNLRMCNDCHDGTKYLSRIEQRKIIVRDTHRVHHFRDGACSCGDSP